MSDSRRTPPPIAAHALRDGEHGDASPRPSGGREDPGNERERRGSDRDERAREHLPPREDPLIVGKPSQAEGDRETVEEDLRIQEEREQKRERRND